jgi:hypothetical protein
VRPARSASPTRWISGSAGPSRTTSGGATQRRRDRQQPLRQRVRLARDAVPVPQRCDRDRQRGRQMGGDLAPRVACPLPCGLCQVAHDGHPSRWRTGGPRCATASARGPAPRPPRCGRSGWRCR